MVMYATQISGRRKGCHRDGNWKTQLAHQQ
jgi:hypothetical protein